VSITGSNKPELFEAEDSTLSNHDTSKVPFNESQRNTTDHSAVVSDSLATGYDSADESSSNPTFNAETLKGITLKEPSSTLAKDNKKGSSALASKLKNVNFVGKTIISLIFKLRKKKSSHFRNHQPQQTSQHHTGQGESSLRSRPFRPVISFPSCIHYRIISLRRGIKPRNRQHVTKHCETCGSNAYTTTDHNDIEWFRKGEAKKAGVNKIESSNVQRSKIPIQRCVSMQN
ncbi:hypothetical protein Tco_1579063, partial [Tanacetum coccineum]